MIEASANIGVQRSVCALLVVRSVVSYRMGRPPKGTPASSFYRHKEGRCTCTGGHESRRLFPESRGCSGRALWGMALGVGDGGLAPSDPGAVEKWLALMPSHGGRVSGRTVCPFYRGVALPGVRRARLNHSHLIRVGEGAFSGRLGPAPASA